MRGRRAQTYVSVAAAAVFGLLATACSSGHAQSPAQASASVFGQRRPGRGAASAQAAADLKISPANGSRDADPSQGVTVTAAAGQDHRRHGHPVRVRHRPRSASSSSSSAVAGTLAGDGKAWHSTWALGVSQSYTVTATGTDSSGQKITTTSTFRTLTPRRRSTPRSSRA